MPCPHGLSSAKWCGQCSKQAAVQSKPASKPKPKSYVNPRTEEWYLVDAQVSIERNDVDITTLGGSFDRIPGRNDVTVDMTIMLTRGAAAGALRDVLDAPDSPFMVTGWQTSMSMTDDMRCQIQARVTNEDQEYVQKWMTKKLNWRGTPPTPTRYSF